MPETCVQAGPFALELAIYGCDATFYRPVVWESASGGFACHEWEAGCDGERRRAKNASVLLQCSSSESGSLRFQVDCRFAAPVKAIKVALDLPYMRMLAPEERDLEDYTWRQWDFPRDWRTGFAVWRKDSRHFTVHTKDFPWRFKRLRALRSGDRMRLEIVQDAALRDRSTRFVSSPWELAYRPQATDLLDDYARFVEQAYGALEFHRRRDCPEWLQDVGLVVNLHGTDWNGMTNLDFAGMRRAADALAERFPPARTILYPIGWDGAYMRQYPDYEPSAGLGGREGFRSFCDRARELGFHVMPHLNAMAVNMRHSLYLGWLKDYTLRDANGVKQRSFKIDWDHDGLGDAAHAYTALEPRALREMLVGAIDRLVAEFGIDAVFLDETCNVFYNDPSWDQVEGVRKLVRDIRSRHPAVLVAGEEWNEMLLGLTPLVQIWEETADGRGGFGFAKSPLMRAWAGRFVRSCGYLALASADGHTGVHEWPDKPWCDEGENEAYYIPTLALTSESLEHGGPAIAATLERARAYVDRFVRRSTVS